ncbi:uncharacterized protein LOC129576296 [Sitodiplosis mosellana]|uniref:uncharacterized protein LOC129576296 n=1 Tax=Sitodiplosis mosellana TaxID=263140 RepID=UPI0024451837|nr:uncharacterized protein LOC129576296 [Sitodiplosis mosellana]
MLFFVEEDEDQQEPAVAEGPTADRDDSNASDDDSIADADNSNDHIDSKAGNVDSQSHFVSLDSRTVGTSLSCDMDKESYIQELSSEIHARANTLSTAMKNVCEGSVERTLAERYGSFTAQNLVRTICDQKAHSEIMMALSLRGNPGDPVEQTPSKTSE